MIGLLRRASPLALLGGSFLLMIGGLAAPTLGSLAAGFVVLAAWLVVAVGPGELPWRRLIPVALAVLSLGWSNWLLADPRSVAVAALAAGRIGFFVVPGVIFAAFVDPARLGDHLGQILRVPGRPVVALVAALQRFERFGAAWRELGAVRTTRGLGPTRSPISAVGTGASQALSLLTATLREAIDSAVAMEARGFSLPARRRIPRTWAEPARWTRADTAVMMTCLGISVVAMTSGWIATSLTGT